MTLGSQTSILIRSPGFSPRKLTTKLPVWDSAASLMFDSPLIGYPGRCVLALTRENLLLPREKLLHYGGDGRRLGILILTVGSCSY